MRTRGQCSRLFLFDTNIADDIWLTESEVFTRGRSASPVPLTSSTSELEPVSFAASPHGLGRRAMSCAQGKCRRRGFLSSSVRVILHSRPISTFLGETARQKANSRRHEDGYSFRNQGGGLEALNQLPLPARSQSGGQQAKALSMA
jgi:hypothetical protein